MPSPLSAREALEIVRRGKPSIGVTSVAGTTRLRISREQYEHALAVLSALVDAHEAACIHIDHLDGGTSKTAGWAYRTFEKVRRIERGENEETR